MLTGEGLDGATGEVELTIKIGDRTFTAATTRREAGTAFPAEYRLHDFTEVVPEPEPVVVAEPTFVAAVEDPGRRGRRADEPDEVVPVVVPDEPEVVAEPEPEPAPVAVAVADPIEADEIAVVRRPITDAEGAVVGYELVGGNADSPAATAGLMLDAFGDIGLDRLAGGHPVWVLVTPEFLLEVGTPPVRPDRVVLRLRPVPVTEEVLAALHRLQWSGYKLALEGYDERLAEVANIVRIPVKGRSDEELAAAVEAPKQRGLELAATDVETPWDFVRCQTLGFTYFQGGFFAKPNLTRQRRVGTSLASIMVLAEVIRPDATFEELEQAIGSDIGLSLKLLRYVNSAFFSLPRTVESVREALTLLGTATVRRWATVVALAEATDAPNELVELALLRARMCEVLGGSRELDASDAHFTVGLFSVADALLDTPMEEVLETLPFSDEIRAALLRREGPKGELLTTVVAYEQGEFPADDGEVSLSTAYGESLDYAGGAVRAAV